MMKRTRIKFCGITRMADALAAAEAGVDAIGMVLHANSPRKISRELARQILDNLPPFVTPVGLFVDAPPALLLEIVSELHLRHIQLHGREPASIVQSLPGRIILKAIRISRGKIAEALAPWKNIAEVKGLLLETGSTKLAGGTGIENDWEAIAQHQRASGFEGHARIIAAGGLRPDNVAKVVRLLRPWGVDVSSGIESAPGIKSEEMMREFIDAVHQADAAGD